MADIVPLRRLDELGAPFIVLVERSVREDDDALHIPDMDGLVRAVAAARAMHPRKLSGPDAAFLRKCVGLRRDEIATRIGVPAEDVATIERGPRPMPTAVEKLFRTLVVRRCAPDRIATFLDWLFEKGIDPVHGAEPLILRFRHAANAGWAEMPG